MKDKPKRRLIELGKDLLILALLASAVFLTLRTQSYIGLTDSFLAPPAQSGVPGISSHPQLRPSRIAVNLEGVGRFAVQYDALRLDETYGKVFSVLSEALGSAKEPVAVEEAVWRSALSHSTGIYFDFPGSIPLSALCAVLDVEGDPALSRASVRRLLVAQRGESTALLYYNESDKLFYVCTTSEALSRLQEAAAGYSANGAVFAYEAGYDGMEPYALLLQDAQLRPRLYQAANPLETAGDDDRDALLEALRFRPQPNSTYRQEDRLVVNEWPDALNILDTGVIAYDTASTQDPRYPVGNPGEAVSPIQALEATWPLAQATVGSPAWGGEAALSLLGLRPLDGGGWQVDYGCTLDAIPVQQGEEPWSARFLIQGGRIVSYTLRLRRYTSTQETSLLLPEVLAAAAKDALSANGELVLVYEDQGVSGLLQAQWIAK